MSEVLTSPAATVPEVPLAPPATPAALRDDRIDLKGEHEDPSFLIINLRRQATSMGVIGAQLPEGRKGIEQPMPVWETGGNGALRRLLVQDRSQMNSNMAAAEQERNFFLELTRRTTLKHAPAVETRIEWPGFGQQTA
ncbi:MAG: hypothetical protein AMXMBFR33_38710 [Candidatus Xenobia bacterium]|jgi:hypothetical protein